MASDFVTLRVVIKCNNLGWVPAEALIQRKMISSVIWWEDKPIGVKTMIYLKDGTEYFSPMTVAEISVALRSG